MSVKPKKIKEIRQQEEPAKKEDEKPFQLSTAMGIFFILLYAFGVYTNLMSGNYFMAVVWTVLVGVNLFFIIRNRRMK